MGSVSEYGPCYSSKLTASSAAITEDGMVRIAGTANISVIHVLLLKCGLAESEVLEVDGNDGVLQHILQHNNDYRNITARLTPLKATEQSPLPARFTVSQVGEYSVGLEYTDSAGSPGSCMLVNRFRLDCKDKYSEQQASCVLPSHETNLNIILGGP